MKWVWDMLELAMKDSKVIYRGSNYKTMINQSLEPRKEMETEMQLQPI